VDDDPRVRALSLDLAVGTIGWAVMVQVGDAIVPVVEYGHFTLPSANPGENRASTGARRARIFGRHVFKLILDHQVQWVFYEYPDKPKYGTGPLREFRVMQGLGFAEGLLVNMTGELAIYGCQVLAVSTTEAKQAALGKDSGRKATVRNAIETRYGWDLGPLTDDESDAVAVAIAGFRLLGQLHKRTEVTKARRTPPLPGETHAPSAVPTRRRRPSVALNLPGLRRGRR
jgi:hypothetical protein